MDCSPPGSSVHGILQARILEWVAISFSRGSSQPRDQTRVSCTAGRFFTDWATRSVQSWIQPHYFMANRRGKGGIATNFPFGSKITVDCDCSHEIRRRLLFGRKAMTNLDSVLKSGDITLLTKVHIVKAMVFPMIMYSCESWTVKKAEHQRTDAFKLWCWRRLLKIPWTARSSNQSILKEINPEHSLEELMKLEL